MPNLNLPMWRAMRAGTDQLREPRTARSHHPHWLRRVTGFIKGANASADWVLLFADKTESVPWLVWLGGPFLAPLRCNENKIMRIHVKNDLVMLSNFVRHLPALTQSFKYKISELLPECFVLVFDGWLSDTKRNLGLFVVFRASKIEGYYFGTFPLFPFENEFSFGSKEHLSFITHIFSLYGKTWVNVSCLIGDGCIVKSSVVANKSLPMLRCARHRSNPAMKVILVEYEPTI